MLLNYCMLSNGPAENRVHFPGENRDNSGNLNPCEYSSQVGLIVAPVSENSDMYKCVRGLRGHGSDYRRSPRVPQILKIASKLRPCSIRQGDYLSHHYLIP